MFRMPKIAQQLGAQPTPRLGGGLGGGLGDASPARRGSPSRTASPPAPLAIRKAPSGRRRKSRRQSHKFFKHLLRLAPQLAATPWGDFPPRPPEPVRFQRLTARRTKNAVPSLTFFFSTCCAWHPNSPPRPGEAPHPAPSARKSVIKLHRKLPSAPLRAPRRFGIRKSPATRGTAHSEVQGDDRGTA